MVVLRAIGFALAVPGAEIQEATRLPDEDLTDVLNGLMVVGYVRMHTLRRKHPRRAGARDGVRGQQRLRPRVETSVATAVALTTLTFLARVRNSRRSRRMVLPPPCPPPRAAASTKTPTVETDPATAPIKLEPEETAKLARLTYYPDQPEGLHAPAGQKSERRRGSFSTSRAKSSPTRRKSNASAKLAIPPAYTDVWICPSARGHLQATGPRRQGSQAIPLPPPLAGRRPTKPSTRAR